MSMTKNLIEIAIVDDNKDIVQKLAYLSALYFENKNYRINIDTYVQATAILQAKKEYQIVLLDIEMPEIDGITLAQELHRKNTKCIICFVSSHQKYALKTYHVHAFDYLLKPIQETALFRLYDEIFLYQQAYLEKEKTVFFQTPSSTLSLYVSQILYIEYVEFSIENPNRSCIIHTLDNEIPIKAKISDIYNDLPPSLFYIPHKSFIVNLEYIDSIQKDEIIMCNDKRIPLSHKRASDFKKVFKEYIQRFILIRE